MPAEARYLARGERAVLQVRRHPIRLAGPAFSALGVLLLAGLIGFMTSPDESSDALDTITGLVALAFAVRLAWKIWNWYLDKIVVTNARIVEISGVLTRNVASMPLGKLTDVTYRRSIAGRLLGYGDLIVESAGQDQALSHIDHIPHPDDFYRTVTTLIGLSKEPPPPREKPPLDWRPEEQETGPLPRVRL